MRLAILALCLAPSLASAAGLTVSFRDGAPKDRFTLRYDGSCGPGTMVVEIDLGTAPAGLIFDVTAAGAGVEVYQPLEWVIGAATTSALTDGDSALTLTLEDMQPGEVRAFTVDIDDTTSNRQITVDGSEMAGATLRVGDRSALFDASGSATVAIDPCTS